MKNWDHSNQQFQSLEFFNLILAKLINQTWKLRQFQRFNIAYLSILGNFEIISESHLKGWTNFEALINSDELFEPYDETN
jgi:hypothetical protein